MNAVHKQEQSNARSPREDARRKPHRCLQNSKEIIARHERFPVKRNRAASLVQQRTQRQRWLLWPHTDVGKASSCVGSCVGWWLGEGNFRGIHVLRAWLACRVRDEINELPLDVIW